ncbi:hypothetical protein [Metabacillus sp. FJAT-52054]|uniref:Uncharacterized protein n=1 Tax=Metabacillus sediminis TaxID=3117746 RepID=A0ABZ2NFT7_9BACI
MVKERAYGYGIGLVFLTLVSLLMGSNGIPYPSSILLLLLFINSIFALFSIIIPKPILRLYETNVFENKRTVSNYLFEFLAVAFSGLNYYTTNVLYRLPLFIRLPLHILFYLLLLWQLFLASGLYMFSE